MAVLGAVTPSLLVLRGEHSVFQLEQDILSGSPRRTWISQAINLRPWSNKTLPFKNPHHRACLERKLEPLSRREFVASAFDQILVHALRSFAGSEAVNGSRGSENGRFERLISELSNRKGYWSLSRREFVSSADDILILALRTFAGEAVKGSSRGNENGKSEGHFSGSKRLLKLFFSSETCRSSPFARILFALGLRELGGIDLRNVDGKWHLDFELNSGNGGGWSGKGNGGEGGRGGGKPGPGDYNSANLEGAFPELELRKEDRDDEKGDAKFVYLPHEKETAMNVDQVDTLMPVFISNSEDYLEDSNSDKLKLIDTDDYLLLHGYNHDELIGTELDLEYSDSLFLSTEKKNSYISHNISEDSLDYARQGSKGSSTISLVRKPSISMHADGVEHSSLDIQTGQGYQQVLTHAATQDADASTREAVVSTSLNADRNVDVAQKIHILDLKSITLPNEDHKQITDSVVKENSANENPLGMESLTHDNSSDRNSNPEPSTDMIPKEIHNMEPNLEEKCQDAEFHKEEINTKERERKQLINEIMQLLLKQLLKTEEFAKRCQIETLKRLQMEAFADLTKIKERVEKMEPLISLGRSSNLAGTAKTWLKGEVRAGTALVMLEESGSSQNSRSLLEQAGIQTGLVVRFSFQTPCRERDLLVTQCIAGQTSSVGDNKVLGGPISLGKVLYASHLSDDLTVSIVPLGAQGKDVTEVVNPLQDQALTEFACNGPVHFNHCKGSAIGATVTGSNFAFALAQYLSGWGNQTSGTTTDIGGNPVCLSTLCQLLFQASERMVFSLSGVNRYWPSPPLPSSLRLHWSELGPLVLPKIYSRKGSNSALISQSSTGTPISHANSSESPWATSDMDGSNDLLEIRGTLMQSIAVGAEVELGLQVRIGGWAQLERGDWLQDSERAHLQWALNLSKISGTSIDWGVNIGCSRPDFWSIATNDQEGYSDGSNAQQIQVEAFLKFYCGRGLMLQPGILIVTNKHMQIPALMLKSSWAM